jgi:hypothetical protein
MDGRTRAAMDGAFALPVVKKHKLLARRSEAQNVKTRGIKPRPENQSQTLHQSKVNRLTEDQRLSTRDMKPGNKPLQRQRNEITGQPHSTALARNVSSGSTATGLSTNSSSGRSLCESL